MKRLLIIISAILLVLNALFAIGPADVKFKMNLTNFGKNGVPWRYINKADYPDAGERVGHNGLLVVKSTIHNKFFAYDLKCTVCERHGHNSSIRMYNRFEAICNKCHTRYEVMNGAGFPANSELTDCKLEGYTCYREGNILYIFTEGLNQRRKLAR